MRERVVSLSRVCQAVLAIGLVGLFCQQSYADAIEGSIAFGGNVKFDAKSLGNATNVTTWKNPFVMNDSGDFADFVHQGASVTLSLPWNFKGTTPPPSPWSAGGFTFNLTSWSVALQEAKSLSITGSGIISGNGFDATPGIWDFASSKSHGVTTTEFSFQADATAVPEPSIFVMMVGGCASLMGVQRLFRRRS